MHLNKPSCLDGKRITIKKLRKVEVIKKSHPSYPYEDFIP